MLLAYALTGFFLLAIPTVTCSCYGCHRRPLCAFQSAMAKATDPRAAELESLGENFDPAAYEESNVHR